MAADSSCRGGRQGGPSDGGGPPLAVLTAAADVEAAAGRRYPSTNQGDPVEYPQVKPKFWLLPRDNTQYILRNFALPNLWGSTWCNRWHHGGSCFDNFPVGISMRTPPSPPARW